ncbi:Sulfur transfer protein involved in thiamine biosynthesis [Geoglobus ahangari]|uniref:Sulfur transfer protein involved in thiamine biosynthesis n=1 Tax=Geoglobus ahangari TaxID=113653 RepID=A0A0F7ICG6_9EURY|nr:MoaD/ThiS family protein [Geoglobus ahangari]AKG90964.1 Sulfur transfer protein involved in thiamine biosynthesis [Geoglobus ahangari]NOY11579.1 MoaD/ThiS family protein [Archaeoglobi archaeon]
MRSQEKSYRRRIKVKFTFLGGFDIREREVEVEPGKKYSELLEEFGINPETVVLVKNTEPVPIDSTVEDGEVKVLRVISGG